MLKLIAFALLAPGLFATAYTSTQTGNWNNPATWGGAGVPGDGDTASIGAHTVTVNVNTTVGTSPNDNTTKVIDVTSGSGNLVVPSGVTLTAKGSIGGVNGSEVTITSGNVLFDASASGGTPLYRFINAGFQELTVTGTANARASISAVSGQTFSLQLSYGVLSITYTDLTRMAGANLTANSINVTLTDIVFTNCGKLTVTSTAGGTQNRIIDRNRFVSGTDSTDDVNLAITAAYTSGTRSFKDNVLGLALTYNSVQVATERNYIGGGVSGVGGQYFATFTGNFARGTRANGQLIQAADCKRNYFFTDGLVGNPHFVEARATSADTEFSNSIFESAQPDLVDYGDAILILTAGISSGRKVVGRNNIVLPNSSGATVSSGTLLTLYNADSNAVTEWYNNTVNVNDPSSGSYASRAAFAAAESGAGSAGQIAVLKSNLIWASSSPQGLVAERLTGTVKDIITAAGADYNWRSNTNDGDNLRGYEDHAGSGDLWTAGTAVAAGVDANGGSAAPRFVAPSRNLVSWAVARGYGSTIADGLTALQAATSRIADLVSFVQAGFIPTNLALKKRAHDGADPGAVTITVYGSTGANMSTSLATTFSGGSAY